MKTRSPNQGRLAVAWRPGWLGFCRPSRCLPALIFVTLATSLPPVAHGEPVASRSEERAIPPVDSHAPFARKVLSFLAVLSLDEKISLVHGATDPTLLGNVGYLPGVPRLGIPERRDA